MIINKLQEDALSMALQAISYELDTSIYRMNDLFSERKEPMVFGVNWVAKGTQTAEDTREYAQKLIDASDMAKVLTDMELTVDYSNDPDPVDIEDFKEQAKKLSVLLKLTDADLIRTALEKIH